MDLNEYQKQAHTFARYPGREWKVSKDVVYVFLSLAGEAGEAANLLKKCLRAGVPIDRNKMLGELGGLLWYVAEAAGLLDSTLEDVADGNINLLTERREQNDIISLVHKVES